MKLTNMTIRLNPKVHEQLKLLALIKNQSMNSIISSALEAYLVTSEENLEDMRKTIALARSRGRKSKEETYAMIEQIAEHDTEDGLGEIKISREDEPQLK